MTRRDVGDAGRRHRHPLGLWRPGPSASTEHLGADAMSSEPHEIVIIKRHQRRPRGRAPRRRLEDRLRGLHDRHDGVLPGHVADLGQRQDQGGDRPLFQPGAARRFHAAAEGPGRPEGRLAERHAEGRRASARAEGQGRLEDRQDRRAGRDQDRPKARPIPAQDRHRTKISSERTGRGRQIGDTMDEADLFRDPYAVLAEISGKNQAQPAREQPRPSSDGDKGGSGAVGLQGRRGLSRPVRAPAASPRGCRPATNRRPNRALPVPGATTPVRSMPSPSPNAAQSHRQSG